MIPHNRPSLDISDARAVQKVLASGWIAEGPVTRRFERETAKLLGRRYAHATSSGTTALHLALLALGVRRGDEVIHSTYACTALLNAVHYAGAKSKLADLDLKNLGPSVSSVRKQISKKTKAIIVHHMYGIPAAIEKIRAFGIPVIEDCAQALGSTLEKKPLGSFGDLTICSFYATKMAATGYGGMVLTDNPEWAKTVVDLTLFDQRKDYKVRYNYSMSDLTAALGLSQLSKLKSFVTRRKKIAARYQEALKTSALYFWPEAPLDGSNAYRFVAGSDKPSSYYIRRLKSQGIQSISPLEPYQLLHRYLGLDRKPFPAAEFISRSLFSVPVYPALTDSEVRLIVDSLAPL